MIKFFYDSLETLQKVTFPTKKDYINLTIGIFVTVIISGFFFVVVDSIFSGAYKTFYSSMRPDGQSELEQQRLLSGAQTATSGTDANQILSGVTVDAVTIVTGDKK